MGKACCGPGPDVERLQAEQRRALKIVLAISVFAMVGAVTVNCVVSVIGP